MIKFECKKCGNCCKNIRGWVYINEIEIDEISKFLKINNFDFIKKYLIQDQGWYILSSPSHNPNCFLKENTCGIYNVRPKLCREYPFWENILQNRQTFLKETEICEGLKQLLPKPAK